MFQYITRWTCSYFNLDFNNDDWVHADFNRIIHLPWWWGTITANVLSSMGLGRSLPHDNCKNKTHFCEVGGTAAWRSGGTICGK